MSHADLPLSSSLSLESELFASLDQVSLAQPQHPSFPRAMLSSTSHNLIGLASHSQNGLPSSSYVQNGLSSTSSLAYAQLLARPSILQAINQATYLYPKAPGIPVASLNTTYASLSDSGASLTAAYPQPSFSYQDSSEYLAAATTSDATNTSASTSSATAGAGMAAASSGTSTAAATSGATNASAATADASAATADASAGAPTSKNTPPRQRVELSVSKPLNMDVGKNTDPKASTQTTLNESGSSDSAANIKREMTPAERRQARHSKQVTNFATRTYDTMTNSISRKYLQNTALADSSTFPARLITTLSKNPWQAAPFLPVTDKDMPYYYGIPAYREPQQYDTNTTPVEITADNVEGNINDGITYTGNVQITQADHTLKADQAQYDQKQSIIKASGNIVYQGPILTISSQKSIDGNLQSSVATFNEPVFILNGSIARGSAKKITIDNEQGTVDIEDLLFTTCPVSDGSWYLKSSEVELEQDDSFGSANHTVLYIKDVPILYLPYINFPTTNERKSGLLYPSASISSINGFDYNQPIYFNLAPNYDYTLSPRILSKRGLLLGNEFRYMPWEHSQGQLVFNYLPHDKNWGLSEEHDDASRYFLQWHHLSKFFNDDLTVAFDYQKVRTEDYDYLDDISAEGTTVTDDHLKQSLRAAYDRSNFNISVEARDYQRLIPNNVLSHRPFSLLPQLSGQYYDTYGPFTFDVQGQVSRFVASTNSSPNKFEATRFHIEPDLGLNILNSRGTSVTANVRGFLTHYNQDNLNNMPSYYQDELGFTTIDSTVSRSLYLLQLRGKTTFERKVLDLRHTQTLEPEIQYQYIPYRNQDNIALYDTTDRMSDYYSNFSYRHYTGYDRISDLNNLTVGLSSRLLDAHDRELMRVGISQTYSFVPSRVTLNPNDPANLYPRSPLSVFFNAAPFDGLTTHAQVTYTNETNKVSSWSAMAQYKNENGFMMQVNYRFADQGNRSLSNNIVDLSQIGMITQIPLNNRFSLNVASYYDLEQNNNIDSKLALKYEESCWSIAFIYENYNSCDWTSLERQSEHRIGIQFEFNGVGAVNVTGNNNTNLNDTQLLDYFDPTNLSR